MTLGEARTIAWDYLDDPLGGYFTEPIMNLRLNLAAQELQKKLIDANQNYYIICVTTQTVIGQGAYEIPEDFFNVSRLERITQGQGDTAKTEGLIDITMNQRELFAVESGYPTHFWMEKNHFQLWPIPNGNFTLRLKYAYKIAPLISDSDEFDAPSQYHKFIPVLAARDGFLKDGRDLAPIQLELEEYKETMTQLAVQRVKTSPRQVVATGGGFGAF